MSESVQLTILMPCLNEAETIARCIEKARRGIERAGVTGEILIADNGSTDGSQAIAEKLGARVVPVQEKGYGNALRGGIAAARGKYILMGDADDSYDFSEADRFVKKFAEGYDLVMGCRLPIGGGTIIPGAMPWKNRWLGNPVLSFIGRLFFKCPAHDFHAGLRAFTKESLEKMELQTTGMEFASEMVIKATLKKFRIAEVPITLHPDGRSRPPHLKPWRDGWRHLRFMLIYSPRWLFLMPGLLLGALGVVFTAALTAGDIQVGGIQLNVGTLMMACMAMVIGFQLVAFAFFTKVFAIAEGLLPEDPKLRPMFKVFTLEKGLIAGVLVLAAGLALFLRALWLWKLAHFGLLPSTEENLRRLIPAGTLIVLGIQAFFSSFFMSVLGLKTVKRQPPTMLESNPKPPPPSPPETRPTPTRSKGWIPWVVLAMAVISVGARIHFLQTRPLAGRLDGQEPESHILVTDLAFEQTSWKTHHFLPTFTLGPAYNKFIDDHPGAETADALGNYYYTSTPPLTFSVPYFAMKALGGSPSIPGLRGYNLTLQLAATAALAALIFLAAKRRGFEPANCSLAAATAAVIYLTAPECLKSHTMNLWAQQFYTVLLPIQLICLLFYPRPFLLFFLAFISCLADWTPYMANTAMAGIGLYVFWKTRDPRAVRSSVAIGLGCLLGGLCMVAWFSTVMPVHDYFHDLMVRSSARSGMASKKMLPLLYLNSFGLFTLIGLGVLVFRWRRRRAQAVSTAKVKAIDFTDPFVVIFAVWLVAMVENLLMSGHAAPYTYDRLKAVQLLALFVAWGTLGHGQLASRNFVLCVIAGLCSLAIFVRIYDRPGGWSYIRTAEQERLGELVRTTASTNGPAFLNGDVRGAEVYYSQRNLVMVGTNAAAVAQQWCREHHFSEGTVYEVSGRYPYPEPSDLPRTVTITRVHANGSPEMIAAVKLPEQAGDYHQSSYANHPFHNWRQLRLMDILKILMWQ